MRLKRDGETIEPAKHIAHYPFGLRHYPIGTPTAPSRLQVHQDLIVLCDDCHLRPSSPPGARCGSRNAS